MYTLYLHSTHPKLEPAVLSMLLGWRTETPLLLLLLPPLLAAIEAAVASLLPPAAAAAAASSDDEPLLLLLLFAMPLLLPPLVSAPWCCWLAVVESAAPPPPRRSLGSASEADEEVDGRRNLLDERMSTLPNIDTPPIGFCNDDFLLLYFCELDVFYVCFLLQFNMKEQLFF